MVASDQGMGWGALLSGKKAVRTLVLAGGVTLHAINIYVVLTVLPSVIGDIGSEQYYSWVVTVFTSASLVGACLATKILSWINARQAYATSALIFAFATLGCSFANSIKALLFARLVQGLGSGLLISLSYSMVQIVFEPSLWSRALGIISAMWGASTLIGPAVGGFFAQYSNWRLSFQALACFAIVFSVISFVTLPPYKKQDKNPLSLPIMQIVLLTILVFAISIGSVIESFWGEMTGLFTGVLLLFILALVDRHSSNRILPKRSFILNSPLFILYMMVLFLMFVGGGPELYLPLFLQKLHGFGPLYAGYMASLISIGWSLGALLGAGIDFRRQSYVIVLSPVFCIFFMFILLLFIPGILKSDYLFLISSAALFLTGFSTGFPWPHLLACIMHHSDPEDLNLASASLTSVQLFGYSFTAAISGMVVNLAGLNNSADQEVLSRAAFALFVFVLFVLFVSLPFSCRIRKFVSNEATTEK